MLDAFATLGQRVRVSASEVFNHLLSGPGSSAYLASNLGGRAAGPVVGGLNVGKGMLS
jgi:hypothetical protein